MEMIILLLAATIVGSAPLYGDDGGYVGHASYKPPDKGTFLQGGRTAVSAGKSGIPKIKIRSWKIGFNEGIRPPPKIPYKPVPPVTGNKYVPPKYAPARNHGYINKNPVKDTKLTPYQKTTLYGQGKGGFKVADGYKGRQGGNYGAKKLDYKTEEVYEPKPYEYGYKIKDKYGNAQHKYETKDAHGTVKGSYGFKDEHGIYRSVEYIADKKGFRANVKTNEPGTKNSNPADVSIESQSGEYNSKYER